METVLRILIIGLLAIGMGGCALLRPSDSGNGSSTEVVRVNSPDTAESESEAAQGATASQTGAAAPQSAARFPIERTGLPAFEKIRVHLAFADLAVTVRTGARRGSARVERLRGDESCTVELRERDGGLEIGPPAASAGRAEGALSGFWKSAKSGMPGLAKCKFGVEINMHRPADLSVDLKRGSVLVENWDRPIDVRMEWGDVGVAGVGALSVACARCTLTGEGVSGPLNFALESGNVGLEGLSGPVTGRTSGDTVLKWRSVRKDTAVQLVSKAGDVILVFPAGIALATAIKAPRDEIGQKREVSSRGVPVAVTAEAGRVRVYKGSR